MGDQTQPRQCIIPVHKPNLKEYIFFFISGILVSIPFTLFFSQLYPFFPSALTIIVLAPFIEELAKVFPLFYRHGETERSYVNLGILIGLGFGISEFVLYVFFQGVPFLVRVPGLVFHSSSAAITAYGIAKKKPWPYYLISVSLHVGNNLFAYFPNILGVGVELFIIITVYLLAWRFYTSASKDRMVV
jgi:RsiW-degrading membrane proteinase PrsW (M82 family)